MANKATRCWMGEHHATAMHATLKTKHACVCPENTRAMRRHLESLHMLCGSLISHIHIKYLWCNFIDDKMFSVFVLDYARCALIILRIRMPYHNVFLGSHFIHCFSPWQAATNYYVMKYGQRSQRGMCWLGRLKMGYTKGGRVLQNALLSVVDRQQQPIYKWSQPHTYAPACVWAEQC